MARPPINDGLDELQDWQLVDLAIEYDVIGMGYEEYTGGAIPSKERQRIIKELRRANIKSPYTVEHQEPQQSGYLGLPNHPVDSDLDEYQHIQRLVDNRYDTEGGPVEAWRVRLTSGNEIIVYGPVSGAIDVENAGFSVTPLEDDDMVTVEAQQHEQVTRQYATDVQLPRRPPPKLPRRRIGKHQQGEVVSLEEQRSKAARGEPSMPFGYEPTEKVSHFPRHRRRT